MSPTADTGWRIGKTEVGFDGVWSQPSEVVAVFHDGEVVKTYSVWLGSWLSTLLAHIYIWKHR